MGLDYERTRAGLQDELDVLGRTRQRLLDQLAPIDERIAAISCAMEALQRAFSGTSHAIIARTTSELDSDGEKSTVSETVETEKKFDITGNIREILGTGKKALAMDIRDALVTRGWNLEESRYKNPMAMVHAILDRLVRSGEIALERDAYSNKKLFFDKRAAEEQDARWEQERAQIKAEEERIAAARARTRATLMQPCREVLRRAPPKGFSARRLVRELEEIGVDLSCYSQPLSAIAALLKDQPGIERIKVSHDGVIRTHYRLLEQAEEATT